MPDDAVFEPAPAGAETSTEAPRATQTPVGLTKEDVAAQVKEGLDPIQKSLSEMNNFFAQLQARASQAEGTTTQEASGGEDWATEFYNKPQETVQAEIASQTAPMVQQAAGTMGKMLLDQQCEAIDERFGAGTWAAEFEGDLAPIVADAAKNYPASLMNPTAVQNAVDSIKGRKFAALAERAKALAEAPAEDNKELVEQVANQVFEMTGGIRRAPAGTEEKLDDPESTEYLKEYFRQTGEELDPKRMAKLMNTGPYYEDWLKATQEAK